MGTPNESGVTMDGEQDFSEWEWKDADEQPDADDLADQLITLGKSLRSYYAKKQESGADIAQLVIDELARTCSFHLIADEECLERSKIALYFFGSDMELHADFFSLIEQEIEEASESGGYSELEPLAALLERALAVVRAALMRPSSL